MALAPFAVGIFDDTANSLAPPPSPKVSAPGGLGDGRLCSGLGDGLVCHGECGKGSVARGLSLWKSVDGLEASGVWQGECG